MRYRKTLIIIITMIVTAVVISFILGTLNWKRYWDLSRVGLATEGHVIAKEPDNHMSVRYTYQANGETLVGAQSVGRSINGFNLGDPVKIYYLPSDPSVSCFCDPRSKLTSETLAIFLAALATSAFVAVMLNRKLR
jgi:hypothetical protein